MWDEFSVPQEGSDTCLKERNSFELMGYIYSFEEDEKLF